MALDTHNSYVKCIKNIVNSLYIKTLNLNSLFVLKRRTTTLNDTCIEASISKLKQSHGSLPPHCSGAHSFS